MQAIFYNVFVKRQVVLDTNVLLSALKSSKGASFRMLKLVGTGKFTVNISTPLMAEYEEVLKREVKTITVNAIDDILDYLCAVAEKHEIFYLWRPVLKDPDDDLLLELAVKSGSAIITFNKNDFRKAQQFGVAVLMPQEFLNMIGETK